MLVSSIDVFHLKQTGVIAIPNSIMPVFNIDVNHLKQSGDFLQTFLY